MGEGGGFMGLDVGRWLMFGMAKLPAQRWQGGQCVWGCGRVQDGWEAGCRQGSVAFWCFRPYTRLQSIAEFEIFRPHPGTAVLRLGSYAGRQCGERRWFGFYAGSPGRVPRGGSSLGEATVAYPCL